MCALFTISSYKLFNNFSSNFPIRLLFENNFLSTSNAKVLISIFFAFYHPQREAGC